MNDSLENRRERSPVRVLHVRATHLISGPEKQLLALLSHPGSGRVSYELLVVGREPEASQNPLLREARARRIRCHFARSRRAGDPVPLLQAVRLVKSGRFDVLCGHEYLSDTIVYTVGRLLRRPVVAVARGYTGENRRIRAYERLDRWLLRRFDRVVAVSDAMRRYLMTVGVRPERLCTIRNAIAPIPVLPRDEARRQLSIPLRAKAVGAVGRLSPEKGHAVLLDAMVQISRDGLDPIAVILGSGPERDTLEAGIPSRGLEGKVVLAGYRDDVESLLGAFDVMVLPSYTEGLPRTLLEAAGAGLPIVASEVGGVPELVRHETTGLLVPAGNPASLAAALERVLTDRVLAARLGASAQELVAKEFTLDALVRRYEEELLYVAGR